MLRCRRVFKDKNFVGSVFEPTFLAVDTTADYVTST